MKDNQYIGLGTAAIGRPQYINIRQEELEDYSFNSFRKKGRSLLDFAYELGIRYFDTAPGYGMAEQLIIDWLKENKDLNPHIATKWGYTYTANYNPDATTHEKKEHSIEKLNEQWNHSKVLLPKLKYYQIHSATLESKVLDNEDILNRLCELKEEHDLTIGLTTTGDNQVEVLKKAIEIERNGDRLFGLVQITYNIFDQSFGPFAHQVKQEGIKIVIKEAMANGRIFPNPNYERYQKSYKILGELAGKYNVGIDAIAIRFCIDSIPVFKVLSGASNKEHLLSNMKAVAFKLEESDIQLLKRMSVEVKHYWNERKKLGWN